MKTGTASDFYFFFSPNYIVYGKKWSWEFIADLARMNGGVG